MSTLYTDEAPVADLRERVKFLQAQIEVKQAALDGTDKELTGGDKGAVTRWSNEIKLLLPMITKKVKDANAELRRVTEERENRRLTAEIEAMGKSVSKPAQSSEEKQSPKVDGELLKSMSRDVSNQPVLCPKLDVSIFVRRMTTVWTTHCKDNVPLEPYFCRAVEQNLCSEYRQMYQTSCSTAKSTWNDFSTYLLDKHKSKTSIYQELSTFMTIPILQSEDIREYAARIKTASAEAAIVIKSKYKENKNVDLDVDSLFELLSCHTLVATMQSHPKYRRHYNRIVESLDKVTTVEEVAAKTSLFAEREVDDTMTKANTDAYVTQSQSTQSIKSLIQNEVRAFLNQSKPSSSATPEATGKPKAKGKPNGKRSWEERCADPDFIKRAKNEDCFREKKNGQCNRTVCPFRHNNSTGGALLAMDSSHF